MHQVVAMYRVALFSGDFICIVFAVGFTSDFV
jgi:hypothetical protein